MAHLLADHGAPHGARVRPGLHPHHPGNHADLRLGRLHHGGRAGLQHGSPDDAPGGGDARGGTIRLRLRHGRDFRPAASAPVVHPTPRGEKAGERLMLFNGQSQRLEENVRSVLTHALLIVVSLTCLFPLFWMAISSLKTQQTIFSDMSLLPWPMHWENFA